MACPNPFKPGDCDSLTQQLQVVHDTIELATKCAACGLQVDGYLEQLGNIKASLTALKREFFPDRN